MLNIVSDFCMDDININIVYKHMIRCCATARKTQHETKPQQPQRCKDPEQVINSSSSQGTRIYLFLSPLLLLFYFYATL
jgi:hypothetical protein